MKVEKEKMKENPKRPAPRSLEIGNHYFAFLAALSAALFVTSISVSTEWSNKVAQSDRNEDDCRLPDIIDLNAPNRYFGQLLKEQKRLCGEFCEWDETNLGTPFPGLESKATMHKTELLLKTFVSKHVDCTKLFRAGVENCLEPFDILKSYRIPKAMENEYTLGGRIKIAKGNNMMEDDPPLPHGVADWSTRVIHEQLAMLRNGSSLSTNKLLKFLKGSNISGKRVLVVGGPYYSPWVEVLCLESGASTIASLNYGKIFTDHPQLRTYTHREFSEEYRQRALQFDVAVVLVSFFEQHSGFGRCGDGLNPWGDVIAMAKASCVVERGGRAIIGVPDRDEHGIPLDAVISNQDRIYGAIRLPYLLTNWRAVRIEDHFNHVLIEATNVRSSDNDT